MNNFFDSVILIFAFCNIHFAFLFESSLQAVEYFADLLFGQILVVIVIHLHHRRRAARGEAFHFRKREPAIRRGLTAVDAQFLLE